MNIDVREYLRINPISVHELTLSDDDNDCFLFFPTSESTRGYMALKQSDLFTELKESIFGGLLDYSQDPPKIRTNDVREDDISGKFKNYVRHSEAKTFMNGFDSDLERLENGLDEIILTLRRKGVLDYAAAVELQSSNTRKLTWTSGRGGPIYNGMSYSLGQIWCKTTDSNKATTGGSDEVSIGNAPLRHKHPDTMAETLTGPLSDKFGGGQLMGDFTIGSKELVAQGTKYGPSTGGKATPLEHATNEALTYPLWGQNILDWRNPKKEHNNVPPSLNIYVRYWAANQSSVRGLAESTETYEEIIERIAKIREVQVEDGKKKNSAAESRYDSAMVCELPDYVEENLTPHDYILRIAYDGKQQIQLWRQGLQMLLDIFSDKTNKELSTEDGSMKELLMKLLDDLLMTVSEFMQWYNQATNRLDAIEEKIEIAEQLCKSVPPLNYIGRIIISYTDDTEQKVIANYGGKSWRRIENFLRGVGANDPNNIPGQKTGEEFVALRESNIPIHSHTETLPSEESEIKTQQQEWMAKNKGGDAKIVNTTLASSDTRNSVQIENTNRNYQISPLEYPDKEEDEITLPHDNLPPYMKMYIWECTELTDEERRITGEPKDNKCVITWLYNGGKVGSASSTTQQRTIGGNHSSIPTPTYANHDFLGWKDMSGQIKTNEQIIATPISGNEIYVAQWESSELLVTFNSNGAQPEVMKRKYAYGEKIGYFPTMDEWPEKAVSLDGWYTSRSGGSEVNEYSEVTGDITLYAHWTYAGSRKFTVKFYHYNENSPYKTIEREEGTRLDDMDNPTRLGYTFKGWFTAKTGGNQVFATQKVYNNLNLYEQWIADTCTITWNPNYTGSQKFTWEREYDSALGTLPIVNRAGYNQYNWWTATSGGSNITTTTVVKASVEYFAHWSKISYNISYDLKGGSWDGAAGETSYDIESSAIVIPTPKYDGRNFLGWTGSNGTTPQLSVTIPTGSTGNKSYVANWNIGTYTVNFSADSSSASGTMTPQTFAYDTYQNLKENTFTDTILVSFNGNGGTSSDASLASVKQFLGWATQSKGAKVYNDKQRVKNLTTSSSTTLYAVWNSGYDKIYLPNAARTGYTFANWYDSASDGTCVGGNGAQYQPPGAITLYAHWTANKYYVTFDPVGGTLVGTSPKQVTYNQAYGTLPSATHNDYRFIGWFTLSEGGQQVIDTTKVSAAKDHILYAHWMNGRMTLTFNTNQGILPDDVSDRKSCKIGEAFGELPTPSRMGYTFSNWYTDETWEIIVTASTIAPENDMEIIAKWNPIYYYVKFNSNGGSGTMTNQTFTYGVPQNLKANTFTKSGYTFVGWAISDGGDKYYDDSESVINLSYVQGGIVNLYAVWEMSDDPEISPTGITITGTRGDTTNSNDPTYAFPWVGHIGRNFTVRQGTTPGSYWDIRYMECPAIVGRGSQDAYFTDVPSQPIGILAENGNSIVAEDNSTIILAEEDYYSPGQEFVTKGGFVNYGSGSVQPEKVDINKRGRKSHGTGGMCLETMDLSNLSTKKLVTKITIFPGISCYEDTREDTEQIEGIPENSGDFSNNYFSSWNPGYYSDLINGTGGIHGTQKLYWNEQSQKHECFPIGMPSTDGYGAYKYGGFIYGRGHWFGVIVSLGIGGSSASSSNFIVTQMDAQSNPQIGWVLATGRETYHSITLNLKPYMQGLPEGCYTNTLKFVQGSSRESMPYNMAIHGIKLYGHSV